MKIKYYLAQNLNIEYLDQSYYPPLLVIIMLGINIDYLWILEDNFIIKPQS